MRSSSANGTSADEIHHAWKESRKRCPVDEIHFTLDGTPPAVTYTKYVNPIPVVSDGATVGVRAIAVRGGSMVSQEAAASWTLHFGFSASATVRDAGPATVEGVCVSTFDGTIDWAQVKVGGTAFAFIRAMDGTATTDARFAANWAAAKSAGVLRAPYPFFEPDQDPVQQTDAFLSMFMLGDGDIPPLLDVEVSGAPTPAECAGRIAQRAVFAGQDRQHWEAGFRDSEACVAPVLGLDEAPQHPQAKARGSFLESGGITQPAPAPRLSATPAQVRSCPPRRREHTLSLLAEAGVGPGQIEQLVRSGAAWVVGT